MPKMEDRKFGNELIMIGFSIAPLGGSLVQDLCVLKGFGEAAWAMCNSNMPTDHLRDLL